MEKISNIIFLILLGLILSTYDVFGQEINKKKYTHDLDSIWSTNTTINNISTNGNWIETSESFLGKNIIRLFHPSTSNVIERKNTNKQKKEKKGKYKNKKSCGFLFTIKTLTEKN